MSKATKKKHVAKEVTEDYPEPTPEQSVVRIGAPRGNNLHEGQWPDGTWHLLSMPTKFRKSVWIKRGDYVIVDPIEEGDKVRGEIVHILFREQVRHLRQCGLWPAAFDASSKKGTAAAAAAVDRGDGDGRDTPERTAEAQGEEEVGPEEAEEEEDDDDDDDKRPQLSSPPGQFTLHFLRARAMSTAKTVITILGLTSTRSSGSAYTAAPILRAIEMAYFALDLRSSSPEPWASSE
eukprot:m.9790 g.9790  ORF g.9790 m.9790 type:complete len:235 (+) comp5646_c0_seq1:125-829(+)